MSDSFIYTDVSNYMPKETKKEKSGIFNLSLIKIVVGILCALLVLEIVIYTIIIPTQVPVKISFSGLKIYSPLDVCRIANITGTQTWMKFDTAAVASAISECSWVESVSVEKKFPDTISIVVEEREPVAVTLVNVNGRTIPVQIDANGILFFAKPGASVSHLPIISGFPIDQYVDGMRLHSKYRPLMEQLAAIQKLPQKYLAAISEIHVQPKDYGSYDLILYPINSQTRVLTDRILSEEALQYMVVVLDVVNSIEMNVSEIDLRYGAVSFRSSNQVE